MPIISDGNGTRVEYTIPDEIYTRIPDYFYFALAGELFSVLGWERSRDAFYPEDDDICDFASGSCGWVEAFRAACRKLGMHWLINYHNSLPWYESDIFDGIIEDETGKRFVKGGCGSNPYYRYLCKRSGEEYGSGSHNKKGMVE